jgi:hypothetical protein
MSYAVKIGTNEAIWIDSKAAPDGWVVFTGDLHAGLVWGDDVQNLRKPNAQELAAAARAAIQPVTRRQMLTALHRAGLLATIKGAVAASGDVELQIAFDESQEFQRNNPFLATMAVALGKTDAEVDAIFALAATL